VNDHAPLVPALPGCDCEHDYDYDFDFDYEHDDE